MNLKVLIISTALLALVAFGGGAYFYQTSNKSVSTSQEALATELVRPHSPVLEPVDAPVTIVEFFDPACEACRAFYPFVKKLVATFPGEVRVAVRYVNFHAQSEEAIRILEAARLQDKFEPVLEALLAYQPEWAPHGRKGIDVWTVLGDSGLDIPKAKQDAYKERVDTVIKQDTADVKTVGVRATPTFFVNNKRLEKFGPNELFELVRSEVELNL